MIHIEREGVWIIWGLYADQLATPTCLRPVHTIGSHRGQRLRHDAILLDVVASLRQRSISYQILFVIRFGFESAESINTVSSSVQRIKFRPNESYFVKRWKNSEK